MKSKFSKLKNKEEYQYINVDTGEVLDKMPLKPPEKYYPFHEWNLVNTEHLRLLVKDKILTGSDYRILLYLTSVSSYENYIFLTQREIATALETSQNVVTASLKKLREKGLIVKGSNKYGKNCYRINPDFCWRGAGKVLAHELAKGETEMSNSPFQGEKFKIRTGSEKPITYVQQDGETYLVDSKGKVRGKLKKSFSAQI